MRKNRYITEIRQKYFDQGLFPCSKCDMIKPLSDFCKDSKNRLGYRTICKECDKEYRKGNGYKEGYERYNRTEQYKKVTARYRKTGANRLNNQKYYKTEKGLGTCRAVQRRRRAKQKAVSENYTRRDEEITFLVFGKACFKCGSLEKIGMDHFYCLHKSNALTITNAIPLCIKCNSSKGIMDPEKFFTKAEMNKIKRNFKKAQKIYEGDYECSNSKIL